MKTRPTHLLQRKYTRKGGGGGEKKEKGIRGKKGDARKGCENMCICIYICFYASKNSEIMQRNFNPCRIEEITRT